MNDLPRSRSVSAWVALLAFPLLAVVSIVQYTNLTKLMLPEWDASVYTSQSPTTWFRDVAERAVNVWNTANNSNSLWDYADLALQSTTVATDPILNMSLTEKADLDIVAENTPQNKSLAANAHPAPISTSVTDDASPNKNISLGDLALSSNAVTGDPAQTFDASFCVPWEMSMDSWWEHHVDWGVNLENDTHMCFAPLEDEDEANYLRDVYQTQYIKTCTNETSLYKEMWSTGYGADIHNVVDGLEYAKRNNLSFSVLRRGPWMYATNECETQDMRCYYLPFGVCYNREEMQFKGNYFLNLAPRILHYLKPYKYLMDYITRPKQVFRKEIYDYVKANSPEVKGSAMCLHVRRTDVVMRTKTTRRYHAISEYMEAAQKIVPERYHRNVILFTDDQEAIEEAQKNYPEHNWIYLNRTRHRGISGGWEGQVPSKSPRLEVIILRSIFRLMKLCDVYVFSTSNIGFIFGSYAPTNTTIINLDAEHPDRVFKREHRHTKDDNFTFVPPPVTKSNVTPIDRKTL
jgi:hypothetical protein